MKVGIAFSGGGLRGAYQVGCYKAFLDCGINVNGFVGTSIGSFNAAMCASNRFYELYNFWYNESTGSILGFSDKLINKANGFLPGLVFIGLLRVISCTNNDLTKPDL